MTAIVGRHLEQYALPGRLTEGTAFKATNT